MQLRSAFIGVGLAMLTVSLFARAPTTDRVAFDVASIKQCRGNDPGRLGRNPPPRWSPGNLTVECQSLRVFIEEAYVHYADSKEHLPAPADLPVEGGPSWLTSDRYTIVAAASHDATFGVMMGPMLQRFLEDRFKLRISHRVQTGGVYLLTVAKDGPTLDDAEHVRCSLRDPSDPTRPLGPNAPPHCVMQVTTDMNGLAALLRPWVDRPVINRTTISGTHQFRLMFAPDVAITGFAPKDATQPSLFTALQEQLRLKLESSRGPVDVLVIDHVEHPSED